MAMKTSVTLLLGVLLLVTALGWTVYEFTVPGPLEAPVTVVLPPSTHFTDIADMLADRQVIAHPFLFKVIVFLHGESSRFKAGEYLFSAHISAEDAANLMASGKTVVHHLTVPEGLLT